MNRAPFKELTTFEEFAELEIRVGTIIAVLDVDKSDKLMKLTVDLGNHICSILVGIK
jgi:tRNA-binding protein